jgi:hypothetical protein
MRQRSWKVSLAKPLIAVFGCATLLAFASPVAAAPITTEAGLTGSTTVIDFSQFTGDSQLTGVNGPVQIGALAGVDVTVQDMSAGSNIYLYDDQWGLTGNGSWNSGRIGYLGIFPEDGPVRITFNDGPVSGFGLFMNYPTPGHLPQILSAFDSSNNLLEMFDVGATAPISTPGGLNEGAFRGIQLSAATIAYVELLGDTAVYDDLRFSTSAPTAIPEPASVLLFGTGLVALARRRLKLRK